MSPIILMQKTRILGTISELAKNIIEYDKLVEKESAKESSLYLEEVDVAFIMTQQSLIEELSAYMNGRDNKLIPLLEEIDMMFRKNRQNFIKEIIEDNLKKENQ